MHTKVKIVFLFCQREKKDTTRSILLLIFKNNNIYLRIYIESYNDLYPSTIYSPPSYDVVLHQLL